MSYDYILIKVTLEDGIGSLIEAAISEPIGVVSEITAQISKLFPSVQWEATTAVPNLNIQSVFGYNGPPEFQLTTEADDLVYMITMSHASSEEVELLAETLGLVVIETFISRFEGLVHDETA